MIHDEKMDEVINMIIEVFTKIEGVELVRLSGLTRYVQKTTGFYSLKPENIDIILRKMRKAKVIDWRYVMRCPHCGEISYQITERNETEPKLCDTCQTLYKLTLYDTLLKD